MERGNALVGAGMGIIMLCYCVSHATSDEWIGLYYIYIYIQGEISFHLKHEIKEVVTYEVTNLCVLLVL